MKNIHVENPKNNRLEEKGTAITSLQMVCLYAKLDLLALYKSGKWTITTGLFIEGALMSEDEDFSQACIKLIQRIMKVKKISVEQIEKFIEDARQIHG